MTRDLAGMSSDVMATARRFGFSRQLNLHPVRSIDAPKLAAAACGLAFLGPDGRPPVAQRDSLTRSLQSRLDLSHAKAQAALILGCWFLSEYGGPSPAFCAACSYSKGASR